MKLPTVFSVAAYIRLSRFGRDYIETGKYLERCFPDRDVRFISITDTATLNKEGIVCSSEYKKINGENYRNSHRTESTSYWTYSTIHRVLQNEMYVGNMVQGRKTQHMRGKQRATDKEDWIIVKGTHEAIIDEDTWNKAQDLLKRRTRNLNLNNNVTAFAGFIKCGDCGRSLVRKNNNYCCGTYMRSGRQYCTPHVVQQPILEKIIRVGDSFQKLYIILFYFSLMSLNSRLVTFSSRNMPALPIIILTAKDYCL